jgi:hypothetical protein
LDLPAGTASHSVRSYGFGPAKPAQKTEKKQLVQK